MRHASAISRIGLQSKKKSDWRVGGRALNQPGISGLHPTAHEKHGREQRSAIIAPKLIFSYLNCRQTNIVVKYSTKGVAILY